MLNSLPIDIYCKVAPLTAYHFVYKYDFLCVSETFLNSTFKSNDKYFMIEGYSKGATWWSIVTMKNLTKSHYIQARGMPLYKMDKNLVLPFYHGVNEKFKNIQNDNIKTQQTNKQSNKHTSNQTDKQTYRHKDWGNKGSRHAPKIQ